MSAWAALSVSVLPASQSVFQPAFVRQLSVLSAVPVVFRVQPAWLSASVALPLAELFIVADILLLLQMCEPFYRQLYVIRDRYTQGR